MVSVVVSGRLIVEGSEFLAIRRRSTLRVSSNPRLPHVFLVRLVRCNFASLGIGLVLVISWAYLFVLSHLRRFLSLFCYYFYLLCARCCAFFRCTFLLCFTLLVLVSCGTFIILHENGFVFCGCIIVGWISTEVTFHGQTSVNVFNNSEQYMRFFYKTPAVLSIQGFFPLFPYLLFLT